MTNLILTVMLLICAVVCAMALPNAIDAELNMREMQAQEIQYEYMEQK